MLVLHDAATLAHETIELLGAKIIPALESPVRISAILRSIQASDAHEIKIVEFDAESPSGGQLLQITSSTHDAGYIRHLQHAHSSWIAEGLIEPHESILPECFPFPTTFRTNQDKHHPASPPKDIFARAGFYAFDLSTGICASTWRSALASAHLAFTGVQTLFAPLPGSSIGLPTLVQPSTILALCRPPGHHCDTRRAGGYCYLNNAVIAVETFRVHLNSTQRTATSPRVAILDLDFHHGNGTQEAFYADPGVLYVSIHGQDEYPYYTGSITERGAGEGRGTNLNLPLPAGSSVQQYLQELDKGLSELVEFAPDFVVLGLGFDTFHLDPLGSFKIETEDYAAIAEQVRKTLKKLGPEVRESPLLAEGVPCLILLEGGYVVERLGANLLSFMKGWDEV